MKALVRITSLLLALVLLAACSAAPSSSGPSPAPASEPEPASAPAESGPTTEPEEPAADMDPQLAAIMEHIDEDYAFEFIKELSLMGNDGNELGFRNAGSTGEKKAAARIQQEMEAVGLDVQVDTYPVDAWEFTSASLELPEGDPLTLSLFAGSVGTPEEGITAEIVDVGDGTAKNYEDKDVNGKIVLAHFDNYNYWFMAPAYEAELAGAKAIIVETIGENYNVGDDTLYCFDVASRDQIPILNITKKDSAALVKQLDAGPVTATLKVQATLDKETGESANIIGTIPGKNGTDQNITLGAHYDGYFHAFMDDVFGIGVMVAMAKAMQEAGYQPEHNIVFCAFGSEEYGAASNHYDWCTGVWNQINKLTPDWAGRTVAHLEIDSVRPDADTYIINTTPEFNSFFEEYRKSLNVPADPYANGTALAGQNGPWSQDYDMSIAGVPGLCAGKTNDSQWKLEAYHTSASSPEADWNPVVYRTIFEQYTAMVLAFDKCAISPLDFSHVATEMDESLDRSLVADADALAAWETAVKDLGTAGGEGYTALTRANEIIGQLDEAGAETAADYRAKLNGHNKEMLDAYKIIQRDLYKLDIWDVVAFTHGVVQGNMKALQAAIQALEGGDGEEAVSSLFGVDTTYLAADFSKPVYEYTGITSLDPARDDLYWGTGKTVPQINTYDVFHSIAEKAGAEGADYTADIAALNALLETEQAMMNEAVQKEAELMNSALEILKSSALAATVEEGEGLL